MLTVVIGLDAVTLRQWECVLPTWRKHRAELWQYPWLVFYDWQQIDGDDIAPIMARHGLPNGFVMQPWPWEETDAVYESQREKMLTGFCYACHHVSTKWWMKIDTDVVALAKAKWLEPEWFEKDYTGTYNSWICPSWSYTKAKGTSQTILDWCAALEAFGDNAFPYTDRLNLASRVVGNKLKMARMCSWVSFYNTAWTQDMAWKAQHRCGQFKIPIGSQDGFHWYCAERSMSRYTKTNMKRKGWTNIPSLDKLQAKCAEVMAT